MQRAIDDKNAVVCAFGERREPKPEEDQYFDFLLGNDVDIIHMNQGGQGASSGTFRDGALIIDFPTSTTATALFLKFQNQVWHTNENDASPILEAPAVPVIPIPDSGAIASWLVVEIDMVWDLNPYRTVL